MIVKTVSLFGVAKQHDVINDVPVYDSVVECSPRDALLFKFWHTSVPFYSLQCHAFCKASIHHKMKNHKLYILQNSCKAKTVFFLCDLLNLTLDGLVSEADHCHVRLTHKPSQKSVWLPIRQIHI